MHPTRLDEPGGAALSPRPHVEGPEAQRPARPHQPALVVEAALAGPVGERPAILHIERHPAAIGIPADQAEAVHGLFFPVPMGLGGVQFIQPRNRQASDCSLSHLISLPWHNSRLSLCSPDLIHVM